MLHCRIFHPTNRCISRGSTSRARSPSPGEGAVRQLGLVPKLIMCLITCPARRTGCPQPPGVRSGAAVPGWIPGAPWVWVWCLGSACAQQERTCQGRAKPGEMPPASGCQSPPVTSGCQSTPALWRCQVPQICWGARAPQVCRGPSRLCWAAWCLRPFSVAWVNISFSTHICSSSCSSFMTFLKSCLIPFFQWCPVGSCPSQPSAGSACLQLLCFLLLTVIGFDFLIAARVFSVIFASCSHCFPLSLFLSPIPPFLFPSPLFFPLFLFLFPFSFFTIPLSLSSPFSFPFPFLC